VNLVADDQQDAQAITRPAVVTLPAKVDTAAATGVELRLVVRSAAVLRAMAAMGADWLLPVYPSLEDALTA